MQTGKEYTPTACGENTQGVSLRLQQVLERLHAAELAAGRPQDSVQLLAVSKRHPAAAMRALFSAGQVAFGESYLQEALEKQRQLADLAIEWHFIGPIQSNKSRAIAEQFTWVHSLDRPKLAERLGAQRPAHLPPLNVCIQVNVSGEASKSGVAPGALAELVGVVYAQPRLLLRGLMAIPAPADTLEEQRAPLRQLRTLWEPLAAASPQIDTLSMGMSDDLEAAVLEGSTLVRIGTALFGSR